jgi:lysophospholipase
LKHPEYQSSTATNGWMWEAVKVQDALLCKKECKSVVTPVLLLSAQNDKTVKNKYQAKLAKRLPNCQMISIEGATHNIYSGTDGVVSYYYSQIFAFLREE